jgi:serine/threonine protein phosphatase PrpC
MVNETMTLDGLGRRSFWPVAPGSYTEDDFWLDPATGLAAVARGIGAIGGQGKPAGKLSVWSLAGEVTTPASWPHLEISAEARLRGGFARADTAVRRLSQSWPRGLVPPAATMAALLLDGTTAIAAHVGDCRVGRLQADGLEWLTRDHTLGAEWPSERVPPEMACVLTRVLGGGGEPAFVRTPVQLGDTFLLATRDVHSVLSEAQLANALHCVDFSQPDVFLVEDDIVRAIRGRSPAFGRATFVAARVANGPARPVSRGSSAAPRLSWLFAPGAPLQDAPHPWGPNTTSRGPDDQWFSEVFRGVMSDDP